MNTPKFYTFNVTITATVVVKADNEDQAEQFANEALDGLDIYTYDVTDAIEQFDYDVEEITLVQTDDATPKVYDDES